MKDGVEEAGKISDYAHVHGISTMHVSSQNGPRPLVPGVDRQRHCASPAGRLAGAFLQVWRLVGRGRRV